MEGRLVELDALVAWKDEFIVQHFPQLVNNKLFNFANIFKHCSRKSETRGMGMGVHEKKKKIKSD